MNNANSSTAAQLVVHIKSGPGDRGGGGGRENSTNSSTGHQSTMGDSTSTSSGTVDSLCVCQPTTSGPGRSSVHIDALHCLVVARSPSATFSPHVDQESDRCSTMDQRYTCLRNAQLPLPPGAPHLACHAFTNGTLHESAEAGQHVDWWVHLLVVQLAVNVNLQMQQPAQPARQGRRSTV